MPPRKSDASRRSDVSTARFAVMDEDPATTPTTGPTPAAPATPAAAASTAPVSAAPSSAAAGAKSTPESAKVSSSTPLTMTTVLNAGSDKKDSEKAPKEKADKDSLTIEDLNLPKSIITRLAKGVLPPQSQIQANAVLAMSKSATVFINYLAAHAEDVFKALEDIEFGFLREPLEQEFAKFNQIQSAKRSSYRQKVAAKKGGAAAAGGAAGVAGAAAAAASADDSIISTASADGDAPRAKKARVDESSMTVDEADDAETEPEEEANEDEDEDEEAEEEEDEDEDEGEGSGEETQDALEEKEEGDEEDVDEAIDGDESD
ncbi:hypothetical protein COL922a_003494 [Colletotrichum nupharicola]|nr:hypothetical protein COL922a_003494 [Colletotrichum nupharicola]